MFKRKLNQQISSFYSFSVTSSPDVRKLIEIASVGSGAKAISSGIEVISEGRR
jgi:hypothetical protein